MGGRGKNGSRYQGRILNFAEGKLSPARKERDSTSWHEIWSLGIQGCTAENGRTHLNVEIGSKIFFFWERGSAETIWKTGKFICTFCKELRRTHSIPNSHDRLHFDAPPGGKKKKTDSPRHDMSKQGNTNRGDS